MLVEKLPRLTKDEAIIARAKKFNQIKINEIGKSITFKPMKIKSKEEALDILFLMNFEQDWMTWDQHHAIKALYLFTKNLPEYQVKETRRRK